MKKSTKIGSSVTRKYNIIANVDLKTITTGPYDTKDDAEAEAERCMKVGIWAVNRLYPPHSIIYIETVEVNIETT